MQYHAGITTLANVIAGKVKYLTNLSAKEVIIICNLNDCVNQKHTHTHTHTYTHINTYMHTHLWTRTQTYIHTNIYYFQFCYRSPSDELVDVEFCSNLGSCSRFFVVSLLARDSDLFSEKTSFQMDTKLKVK